jgi:type 1 fimbriae regulatory protein FimE
MSHELRRRRHLTEAEIVRLVGVAKASFLDATMILVTYRHGLRAAELLDLRWDHAAHELSG